MTKRQAKQGPADARPTPGPKTSKAIQNARDKFDAAPLRPSMKLERDGHAPARMGPGHCDVEGHSAWLLSTFGTTSQSFLFQQLSALEVATAGAAHGDQPNVAGLNAALALVAGINPTDELEAALATQMAGCHALSMAMLCRAKTTSRADQLQMYGNLAVKLQRTFTAQIEALARMRGKGQQTVRVEHVTVQAGAQAIVGDVNYHPGAPGGQRRTEGQPYASNDPATTAKGGAALPSPNSQRNGVPIPGNAERPMPSPRRSKPRSAAR